MADNMRFYNRYAEVPKEAQKPISAGRLKGMTDINPMWRINALTEMFGPVGDGWYTHLLGSRVEEGSKGQRVAVVEINLHYKLADGTWSAPIYGTGGSMLVAEERNGLYTSDEAFKMAYTDALSVCCKHLGIGANVYWSGGRSKYNTPEAPTRQAEAPSRQPELPKCSCCGQEIKPVRMNGENISAAQIALKSTNAYGKPLCWKCSKEEAAKKTDTPPWEEPA